MLANLKMPRSVVHFLSKFEVSDITCKRLLQWSCKNGYLHVTRTILDKRNLFDVKWLYYSARVGDVESCAYLLQFLEEWDTTIWIASMDSGSYQVATLFLEYGDFESLDTTDQFIIAKKAVEQTFEMMTLFLDKAHPDVYDMIDETQQTLMHCAAANPDPQIIQYVGKRSRARDAPDRIGMTPLKIAQMLQLESVQVAILSL
ncbi:hypothetical protein EDD86DRAFT_247049 [Gorgonomyces haynaldii]|nr:hypothetical protein EDD86DRAFT_247049 [Gorgonomyces haynaldii]